MIAILLPVEVRNHPAPKSSCGTVSRFAVIARTHSESDVPTLSSAINSAAKSERDMPAVTTAAEILIYAAERQIDWVVLARMATLQAICQNEIPGVNPDRLERYL